MKKNIYLFIVFAFMNIGFAFAQSEATDITTKTSQFEDVFSFNISPNPASEKLNIELNPRNQTARLQVFDVLGKALIDIEISITNSSINVSNWNNGIYIVRVNSGDSSHTKRFVKQ